MGLGSRIGDTLRVPGRGLRRIVTVLVVLALAAATGGAVSLSAPGLVASLGLEDRPAAAAPPVPLRALGPLPVGAPVPTAAGLAAVLDPLAGEADLGELSGVVIDPADGSVLWESDPALPLVPGSTTKVLTAAAVLLTLDPTEGLDTRVVAGPDPRTVVLVGGGDPTLTALPDGQVGTYPNPSRLTDLAEQVQAAAPGPVERVLVDTSRYRGELLALGWDAADVPGGFVAPIVPLMLDGGRADPAEQDGSRLQDPATAAGEALAELLGGAEVESGAAGAQAEELGSVTSAPIGTLVEHVMRSSDNVLAETLAREVAIARGAEPTFEGAAGEILAALRQAGVDPAGTVLLDGSGLSRDGEVPARALGAVLAAAAAPADGGTEFLRPIVTGLPVAGGDGTLDDRFDADSEAAAGRGIVRAKTGSLSDVSSLAGIVTDADGRLLVFAFVSNGTSPLAARPTLDAMATALAGCGCR